MFKNRKNFASKTKSKNYRTQSAVFFLIQKQKKTTRASEKNAPKGRDQTVYCPKIESQREAASSLLVSDIASCASIPPRLIN
jgi:hypothetical protein